MKKIHSTLRTLLSTSVFALALSLASTQVSAYVLDTKIGEANLGNSGDATELNTLKDILTGLGEDSSGLSLDFKLDQEDASFNITADSVAGQWYIDVAPKEPGYFLLKFGTGGTNASADTFFFANIGELSKLVFSNAQVQFLSGGDCSNNNNCNIGRLSHYSIFNDSNNPPPVVRVPEPASLLLLGAGLIGLGFARRKTKHN